MAVTAASLVVRLRWLMIILMCIMVAVLAYVIIIGGFLSCFNFRVRWAVALLIDFSIYAAIIGAWFLYKESSWIRTAIFVVLMYGIGSLATCGYILMQLYKLSPEEASKDPLYFVLVRHQERDTVGHTRGPSVTTTRVIFSSLGCLMLGALIYTIVVDVTHSNTEGFAQCLLTYLTDIYIHAVVLAVWIAYKESSWINAFLWILSLICLGNITICVYIVRQLSYLSPEQPVSLIIFSSPNRNMQSSDPLLIDGTQYISTA